VEVADSTTFTSKRLFTVGPDMTEILAAVTLR
jgi:hypothetical protein